MTIGILELSNRRTNLLKGRALKKLKEQRKATRAAMQWYEGATNLGEEEKATYADLTLSMVLLNALSDHLLKSDFLPKTWDSFTLGSDFDKHATPLLRKGDDGDLWVEYYDFARPKELMSLVAGKSGEAVSEEKPTMRVRPTTPRPQTPEHRASKASDTNLMDLIKRRMPNQQEVSYKARMA